MKILHWDVEGVSPKELTIFLRENNIDVCCIQETHLQTGKSLLRLEDINALGMTEMDGEREES